MTKLTEFDINDSVTLSAAFTVNDALTDPTTIALSVTSPSGIVSDYTYGAGQITRTTAGRYIKEITADEAGEWTATWTGTGTCIASTTRRFVVRRAGA